MLAPLLAAVNRVCYEGMKLAMTPTAGERFGPYEILDRLGRGGMGLVYRAWDGRLHREVALKLLHTDYPLSGSRERFLQEARAASALNHPNICTVFDIGEREGVPYLVMELMEGETLRARMLRGAIPVDDLVRYGREIAEALGAAHARGIVHRDIKPANIFLVEMPNGHCQCKVLDFGLAKVGITSNGASPTMAAHAGDHLTSDGATVGTVAYMSPEQARGEALDARADLFSLGVVMYEMATRHLPFLGNTNALSFDQLLNHDPEPVREWNESVSRPLEKLIFRLLAKDRAERFQTAAEVSAALTALNGKAAASRFAWGLRSPTPPVEAPSIPLIRTTDPVARPMWPTRPRIEGDASGAAIGHRFSTATEAPWIVPGLLEQLEASGSKMDSAERAVAFRTAPLSEPVHSQPETTTVDAAKIAESHHELEVALEELSAPVLMSATGIEPAWAGASVNPRSSNSRSRRRLWITGAAVIAAGSVAAVVLLPARSGVWGGPLLGPNDPLLVTAIDNRTGDPSLDGTITQALQLGLEQSPYLALRDGGAFRGALRRVGAPDQKPATPALARQAAQASGAKAYLSGAAQLDDGAYTLSADVLDSATNRKLAGFEEKVPSRDEIPRALDALTARLRSVLAGETVQSDSPPQFEVPLAQEATANLAALHDYALGEAARLDGRTEDAIAAFQSAARRDPKFVQAEVELAWLYRWEHAETASTAAARQAEAALGSRSSHTTLSVQYTYEVNATGNMERAAEVIRRMVALYPHDPEGARGLARVLRLQGRFSEALDVAEKAIADDPNDGELYGQAEFALVGLDRYDAALALEQQSRQMALPHYGTTLTAAYLAGNQPMLAAAIQRVTRPPRNLVAMAAYGLYLDNSGQLAAGTALWRAAAADKRADAPGWLLAQAALDRALAGECGEAIDLAHTAGAASEGMTGIFHSGMAAALCGEKPPAEAAIAALSHEMAQASAVSGYYLPDLKAAMALGQHDPKAALEALQSAHPYDLISLTPYLRGLAHEQLHQTREAIVDFEIVLGHRGLAVTGGSDVYPMAQLALARAYAASGDKANSARAYRRFQELWPHTPSTTPSSLSSPTLKPSF